VKGRGTRDEGRGTAMPNNRAERRILSDLEIGPPAKPQPADEPGSDRVAYAISPCEYSTVAEAGPVRNFEDLIAWQKARELAKAIYIATRQRPFSQDFGLAGQIQRAAVSVMSNIAEGHERGSSSEFHHFLSNAKGSCAEVRCQLYVAFDAEYLDEGRFRALMALTQEVNRIIGGLRAAIGARRK